MSSRSTWILALAVLAILAVVGWTARTPTRSPARAFDARRGRALVERFFTEVRSGALPALNELLGPVPWGMPSHSEERRREWEIHLAAIEPRLLALEALLDDADVQGLVLEGDGAPTRALSPKLMEIRPLINELAASAELALDRDAFDDALEHVTRMLEFALLYRDRGDFWQALVIEHAMLAATPVIQHSRWEASRAYEPLAVRLRASITNLEHALSAERALERRFDWALGSLRQGMTLEGALDGSEREEEWLTLSIARQRVLLLALAADAFRADHGRWPTSTSELAPRIGAADLEPLLAPERLELAPVGADLRVGMLRSTRPANEVGTTLLLVRGNARHAARRLPFDEAGR